MVELMKSLGNLRPEAASASKCRDEFPVKLEIVEDFLEEGHASLNKRPRVSPSRPQPCSNGTSAIPVQPKHYNPLDEPSPLGLSLRKSPSLVDLIQMRLSQGMVPNPRIAQDTEDVSSAKKDGKAAAAAASSWAMATLGANEKLKASNFPASLLRIGQWEYKSRYEGDLVAKCYFAKHKLVWEVLEHGLKSKIEIQWSDIMAMKANCPEDEPGTLTVVLARQPLFFRETNPQPRKHTLWQATSDFTDGQASSHRQHFLQCPQGLLNKHYEKLIQCDHRLFHLSQQPEIILESPYFEGRQSIFEDPGGSKGLEFEQLDLFNGSMVSSSLNMTSPIGAQSSSELIAHDTPSPSSVMDTRVIEGSRVAEAVDSRNSTTREWDKIKVPGMRHSMSVSDFINQLEHCFSEPASGNTTGRQEILDIARDLLSDTQTTLSDEKSLMMKVDSLCCLLQKEENPTMTGLNPASHHPRSDNDGEEETREAEEKVDDASSSKVPGMSRKDSFLELLSQLPRIESLSHFLPFITEEDGLDAQNR